MREAAWRALAWLASRGPVFEWLRRRALATPYSHIGPEENRYMWRYWLFNAYGKDAAGEITPPRWPSLPSARLHLIMRPDRDHDKHDHPWDFRTLVLKRWYSELRDGPTGDTYHVRRRGDTASLRFGEYHRITEVAEDGVWTLFITWQKRGSWGFNVNGVKVPWREYLAAKKSGDTYQ
jgi:hypothetical protein